MVYNRKKSTIFAATDKHQRNTKKLYKHYGS